MEKGTTGSAEVHIAASPEAVYAVVSDVTRMGEWSPETTKCEWIDGATGAAVGARFKGTNKRGLVTWSTKPVVTAADPGREFAFEAGPDTRWTYRFEADGDGAKVTESFELLRDMPWYISFAEKYVMRVKDRKADLEAAMATTLGRIKFAVEAQPAAPS
jgi:hypothetical protein